MKRQQLIALGLAAAVAGSTVTGGTMNALAANASQETVVMEEAKVDVPAEEKAHAETPAVNGEGENGDTTDKKEEKPEETQQTPSLETGTTIDTSTTGAVDNVKSEDAVTTEGIPNTQNADAAKAYTLDNQDPSEIEIVNKIKLNEVIKIAEKELEHESRYTKKSFKNFKTVLEEARAVAENESATQQEVDAAAEALEAAFNKLIFTTEGYSQYIQDIINNAENSRLGELMYTKESWNAYQAALKDMNALKNNPDAYKQTEANQIITEFYDAFYKLAALPEETDKTELREAIASVQYIVDHPTLFENLTVATATMVLDQKGLRTDEEIDALDSYQTETFLYMLQIVITYAQLTKDGIIEQANVLKALVDELRTTRIYNATVLDSLTNRIEAVLNILKEPSVTSDQIETALQDLSAIRTDIESLELDVDSVQTMLGALVETAKYKELYEEIASGTKKYTKNSQEFYKSCYEEAAALVKTSATETADTYLSAYMNLQAAYPSMVLTINAGQTMLGDLDTIIKQETDTVEKLGGITKDYMKQLKDTRDKLDAALKKKDDAAIERLVNTANETILAANEERILEPEKKPEPNPENRNEKSPTILPTSTVPNNGTTTKTNTRNPKTGDPVSIAGLLALLGGSAGVIAKAAHEKKRRRNEDEE